MKLLDRALKAYMSAHDKASALQAMAEIAPMIEIAAEEDIDTLLLYLDNLTKNYLERKWHTNTRT